MFGVWVAEEPAIAAPPPIEAPSVIDCDVPVKLPATTERTLQWLDPEARVFVATEGYDRWIFIRVIQAATGKIQSRVILRMPEKVGAVEAMVAKSNSLVIISDKVSLFEISLTSWEPLFWRSSQELVPRGEIAQRGKVVPDTRFVWFLSRRTSDLGRVCVVDAQRRRVARELEDIWDFVWVADAQGARMICSGSRDRVTLHDMRGAPIQERLIFSNATVNHAVVHPSGRGLLVTTGIDEALVGFEEISIAESHRPHVCHEFALALIHVGQSERAIAVLLPGIRAGESSCNLPELLDLVSPLPDKSEKSSGSVLIRIRLAVQNYDFWLNNRAFDKAREARRITSPVANKNP